MGKTRDLLKKIRDTKGTFHAKVGTIKNRSKRQRREGMIYTYKDKIAKNSKER